MAAFTVVQELCFPESGLAVTAGDGVCVCVCVCVFGVVYKVLSDAPTSRREISPFSMPVCTWHIHCTADENTVCRHGAAQYRKILTLYITVTV